MPDENTPRAPQPMGDDARERAARLYKAYRHECMYVAMRKLKDHDAAENVVHDAFAEVLKTEESRRKYLPLDGGAFRTAIIVIVKNECFDILRKRAHVVEPSLGADADFAEIPSNDPPVPDKLVREEDMWRVFVAMGRLSELEAHMLILKHCIGLTYKEIGAALRMNTRAVETREMRARAKIRKMMEKEGGENEKYFDYAF